MSQYSLWEQDETGAPVKERRGAYKSMAAAVRAAERLLRSSPAVEVWADRSFEALVSRPRTSAADNATPPRGQPRQPSAAPGRRAATGESLV